MLVVRDGCRALAGSPPERPQDFGRCAKTRFYYYYYFVFYSYYVFEFEDSQKGATY